jgi:uncharacterized membrane protein YGL010W
MKTIEERMAGYAAYHKNPKNKFTHFFGVPMVYYSPLIALGWVPLFEIAGLTITLAWAVFAFVMIWYFTLDFQLASIMLLISIPIVYGTDILAKLPFYESLGIFLGINIVGWAIQLIGHVFEGRRPALVDNLLQSLMAPLFLIAEVLFFLGIRKDLEKSVSEIVTVLCDTKVSY